MLQNFAAYKPYLEADEEIRNIQRAIKSQKEAERRCLEEQKQAAKEAAKYVQPTPHWIVAETGRLLLDVYDEKIPFEENE